MAAQQQDEARRAVDALRATDAHKRILLAQIDAGNAFAVFAALAKAKHA